MPDLALVFGGRRIVLMVGAVKGLATDEELVLLLSGGGMEVLGIEVFLQVFRPMGGVL